MSQRSWMWRRTDRRWMVRNEYAEGVIGFLNFAFSHEDVVSDGKIKCPCARCINLFYKIRDTVQYHLHRYGFMRGYDRWVVHGESLDDEVLDGEYSRVGCEEQNEMQSMVMDIAGPEFNWNAQSDEQPPNKDAQRFFDLLNVADEPLYDGCKTHTKLPAMSRLFNLKSEFNMSEACYDRMVALIKEMLPEGDRLPKNLYKTQKGLAKLGLEYEKIDSCKHNCILYYKEKKNMLECSVCHHPRYKPQKPGS